MSALLARILPAVGSALKGQPTLQFVVISSVALSWIVLLLTLSMLTLRGYHALRGAWRSRRRKIFEAGVEKILLEEPFEAVVEAFRPRLPGDTAWSTEVMCEAMRHLLGPPLETLERAARELGFIELNLERLSSRNKHERGRAIEALGLMRAREAIAPLVEAVNTQPRDLKLVALRSLAIIGEPSTLDVFLRVSDQFSPAMMVRLASLMLEFGAPARPKVAELIARHPSAFPPRVMRLFLAESAAADEGRR